MKEEPWRLGGHKSIIRHVRPKSHTYILLGLPLARQEAEIKATWKAVRHKQDWINTTKLRTLASKSGEENTNNLLVLAIFNCWSQKRTLSSNWGSTPPPVHSAPTAANHLNLEVRALGAKRWSLLTLGEKRGTPQTVYRVFTGLTWTDIDSINAATVKMSISCC